MSESIEKLPLKAGSHTAPSINQLIPRDPDKVECCVMERLYLEWCFERGAPLEEIVRGWTDSLPCVCSVLAGASRRGNDRFGTGPVADARREAVFTPELRKALIGTAGSAALRRRRQFALADWSIRSALPRILGLSTSLASWGPKLAALQEITSDESRAAAYDTLWAMRNDAWRVRSAAWAEFLRKYAAEAAAAAAAADGGAGADDLKPRHPIRRRRRPRRRGLPPSL